MRAPRVALLAALAVTSSLALIAPAHSASAAHRQGKPGRCALPTGESTVTVASGGQLRTAIVYRPTAARGGELPVYLTLHGSSSRASEQLTVSGIEKSADRHGFLAVAPQGAMALDRGYQWNVPGVTGSGGPDDERYLSDLLDSLAARGCADTGQVLATGYSGGGRMVSQYACDHPERVTAIAPVAGLRAGVPVTDDDGATAPDTATCTPKQPVPVLTFQGTADPVNPYDGGGQPYWGYGARTALAAWARLDHCRKAPVTTPVSEHVTKISYAGCRGRSDVELYSIDGDGHTWPGSDMDFGPLGHVTQEIDATELAWHFFQNHHNRVDLPTARDHVAG
ncbi:alpha/beta hydrolase family esterase [Streptomyces sp. NBC_00063]|uniref:alpha/beta hydrolase family esterase n=1 Tax=Streptomyces sp. NBC_00063 TaxID=2975638 RepID=UPI003D707F32